MRAGRAADDRGFIMVAMLVAIAVAAVWMSAALPSWRQQAIREKEAELVFRGEQYARAIFLYRQRNNAGPQTIDQLVDGRFLRKKYLDPITGKDFVPLGTAGAAPAGRQAGPGQFAPAGTGGIIGVRSTSNEQSIKIYNNQSVYSQWAFDWIMAASRAGAAPTPEGGRRGQPGVGREGRGVQGGGRGVFGPGGRGGGDELGPITPRRGGPPIPPPPPPPPGRGGRGF